ncbi:Sister chromatid cohesion protein 2 [Taxawa tesnikishii (nom. ined.)]|nr:Sister chromatid cohesion protein 2 [Dothideales sp. JES 119]
MVVVPRSMNASQRAEYQAYPETAVQSRKEAAIDKETLRAIMDQRQKSSVHVNKLQDLINNILEAEDQLEPDTSGAVSTNAALFFASDDNPDSHTPALLLSVHIQLDKTLLKVANAGRLQDIPVEQLVRVQKLCDNAITIASAVSLGIGEDWSDSDIEDWRQRLATANRALQASLFRGDASCLVGVFSQQITDIFIVPVVEMRADSPAFSIASSQKKPIYDEIVVTAQRVLKLLGDLLVKTDVNDSAITSVQFLCKTLIFVENAGSEKILS